MSTWVSGRELVLPISVRGRERTVEGARQQMRGVSQAVNGRLLCSRILPLLTRAFPVQRCRLPVRSPSTRCPTSAVSSLKISSPRARLLLNAPFPSDSLAFPGRVSQADAPGFGEGEAVQYTISFLRVGTYLCLYYLSSPACSNVR